MDEGEIGTINHPSTTTMMRSTSSNEGLWDTRGDFGFSPPPPSWFNEEEPNVKGNISNHGIIYVPNNAQYCYSLLEAMPLPGPIWSTTAPSLLAEQPLAPIQVEDEGEFGENQGSSSSSSSSSSSYTWWLGFLEGLDHGNCNMDSEKLLGHPFVGNVVGVEDSNNKILISNESSPFVDEMDLGYYLDDWLMIPTMEKDLGDMVMP